MQIIGYARSAMTAQQLGERLRPYLHGEPAAVDQFLSYCTYVQGDVSAVPRSAACRCIGGTSCTSCSSLLFHALGPHAAMSTASPAVSAGSCTHHVAARVPCSLQPPGEHVHSPLH
jgi:hypothetical protein